MQLANPVNLAHAVADGIWMENGPRVTDWFLRRVVWERRRRGWRRDLCAHADFDHRF